jgi:TonB family protein
MLFLIQTVLPPRPAKKNMQCSQIPAASSLHPGDSGEGFLKHFGFREQPFAVTPDPSYLFFSEVHRAALESLVNSIECNLGFSVLIGAPGMGKTSLLLRLLTQYRTTARTAFVFQTQCKPHDLLRHLAYEFEIPLPNDDNDEVLLHRQLKEMLVHEAHAGRKVIVMIDEAQNLCESSLEAIRLLSNFETRRAKLLHIVLAGSGQLNETLSSPGLSQLAQRISTVCHLEALRPHEVSDYVAFRLERAGCGRAKSLFSAEALSEIVEQGRGVPRIVNSLSYGALWQAYIFNLPDVTGNLVRQAARNLILSDPPRQGEHEHRPRQYAGISALTTKYAVLDQAGHPSFAGRVHARETDFAEEKRNGAVADSFTKDDREQNPSSRPKESATQFAQEEAQKHSPLIDAAESVPVLPISVPVLRGARNDWVSIVLILLVLIIVGMGWYQFRAKPDTAAKSSGGRPENVLQSTDTSSGVTSSIAPATSEVIGEISNAAQPGAANPKLPPGKEKYEALPQLLFPSKLHPGNAAPESTPGDPPALRSSTSLELDLLLAPTSRAWSPQQPNVRPVVDELVNPDQNTLGDPIKVVKPDYPKAATLGHIEGEVIVEMRVAPDGHVQNARAITGEPVLAVAAEEAARRFEYPPFPQGQALAVTTVRFNFKLPGSAGKQ